MTEKECSEFIKEYDKNMKEKMNSGRHRGYDVVQRWHSNFYQGEERYNGQYSNLIRKGSVNKAGFQPRT